MSSKFIIIDWAGNRKLSNSVFNTFDDAWEFIYEQFGHLDDKEFNELLGEFEVKEIYNE